VKRELIQQGYLAAIGQHSLKNELFRHMNHAFQRFAHNWHNLCRDSFLRDGGDYRYRRYSVFQWNDGDLDLLPHEPHFQSSYHNGLHGGFPRFFPAWSYLSARNPVFYRIVKWVTEQVSSNSKQSWRIQAHQFRIKSSVTHSGKPTPEGIHKDGAEFILIMLLDRKNITGGISEVYDNNRQLLGRVCMQEPGDLLLINDDKVYHGVTEIEPVDSAEDAYRDVLVLTFHAA
jgi:hypothetical protein